MHLKYPAWMIGEASQWTLQDTHYIRTHYKWNLIKNQTRKQNITRNIEIKNNLTVTRGEVGGNNWGKGGKVFRNTYKGHMDKTTGG